MPDVFSGTFTRRFLPHFSRVGQHRCGIIHCGLIRLSRFIESNTGNFDTIHLSPKYVDGGVAAGAKNKELSE